MATSYRQLATNSRFLRGAAFTSGDSVLHEADRKEAELQAAVEIETGLGCQFTAAPDAPPIIALLGDLIGSAVIFEYLAISANMGKDESATNKPTYLRKKAQQILDDLRAHKIGVQAADGSYPYPLYPAPSVLPLIGLGEAKNITIDAGLAWGQMAQGKMTSEEKEALDTTRDRRAFDLEASFAGAYGL